MKYRVLVGLLALLGLGVCVSCGGSSSNTTTNPGVTGTGLIFVTTQGDNKITPYTIDRAAGKVTANGDGIAAGTIPSAAIMTPSADAIFITNQGSADISRYTIKSDGTLAAVTPNISVGGADSNPIAMTMDAAGKLLFVLNQGTLGAVNAGSVAVFTIGQNGALTPAGAAGNLNSASAITVTPDAKYLFVSDSQYSVISGFSVDASGGLTLITPPNQLPNGTPGGISLGAATTPMGLLTTPDDAKTPSANPIFLYVANAGTGNISVFEICDKPSLNCTNNAAEPGDLLELTNSPFVAGGEPGSMVMVHPALAASSTATSGTFLYAADKKLNHVLQYSVSPVTGNLTQLSPASVSAGTTPLWIAARPDGQYLFAANNGSNSMSAYTITDPQTGLLTNATTAVVATGNNPSTIVVR